ncbi:type VI secretion system tip protein TssI/VgrG [Sorangium sp. So ce295]|jgi:type VI secretion system secreted protein VgrG|uniref:type VI secretion system Vgr family protein n=1 Tax=Sorangium sp. So ce295 TaxID=3133295 RepID=UPI003F5E297E
MADTHPSMRNKGTGLSSGVYRVEAQIASGDMLDVRRFQVTERISSLFEVQIVAVSDDPDIDFEAVIGQPMTFTAHGNQTRVWSGLCSHLQQVAVEERYLSTYELTLVPRLWLATQRRNYRMFQHKSEVDIVLQLLGEWGISPTRRLAGEYKKRKYRVQYGESDYTFISRMLEDAGVSFYFDNGGESQLVLDDRPQANVARVPITYRDHPTDADREHVTKVVVGRRLRPGKYTVRDHDHRRPANYKLLATASGAGPVEDQLERFHYVPGAFLFESQKGESSPTADDQGKYRADESEGEALAQRRLEAKRASAREIVFKTNVIDPAPGAVLSFLEHPKSELGPDKKLLVLESQLSGEVPAEWEHSCVAVSADAPYRPPLRTRKPRAQGVESATVVGPPGEEIHVDEFGRVRAHFHWDRESKMNNDSSCWIHVSQPWGGAGFGGTNLPRIGQEVIVDFLGGDPDRPIIVGRVYTNLQKTPYSLPMNKTQSGWKSNSSPSTYGYNEIMFEDKAGSELVRMQAEKDLHKLVKNDQETTIGRDRTTGIGHDEDVTVGNNATKSVLNSLREAVGMIRARAVGVDEVVQIGRNQTIDVGEKIEITCGKSKFVMDKDGNITLKGVRILVDGSEHVQVFGDPIDLN